MAASKDKKRTTTDLPDDIILHIIARLPLKHAARCRILSKHFHNAISTPQFVLDHHHALLSSSNNNSSIILHHADSKFTRINYRVPPRSITLPTDEPFHPLTILDSCNGLLLLYHIQSGYYVFNPFTSGVMSLKYSAVWIRAGSLVVQKDINNPSSSNFDFKLVELRPTKPRAGEPTLLFFRVYVPRRKSTTKMVQSKMVESTLLTKKLVILNYPGCSFEYWNRKGERERRPVYTHGCVHWLEVGSTAIAAFDVESGRARIMDGPVTHAVDGRTWFGSARGSLQFIRTDNSNNLFIVHTHNYVTQEWRVAHKIQMMMMMMIPADVKKITVVPVFFDGKNVLFHKSGGNVVDILEHDLSIGEWRKSGQVDELIKFPHSSITGKGHHYLEYVPTRARASAVYLSKMPTKLRSTLIGISLLRLQHLLLD